MRAILFKYSNKDLKSENFLKSIKQFSGMYSFTFLGPK